MMFPPVPGAARETIEAQKKGAPSRLVADPRHTTTPAKDRDRVTSVPPPADMQEPPTQVLLARWARADGCPECVANVEVPRGILASQEGHRFTALYRCADCGHTWPTGWTD